MKNNSLSRSRCLLAASLFIAVPAAHSQSVNIPIPKNPNERQAAAINSWRRLAVSEVGQLDQVNEANRKARDTYWSSRFPSTSAYIVDTAGGVANSTPLSNKEFTAKALEFPWVIGTFESYKVFHPAGSRGLYTEITFRILHNFPSSGKNLGLTLTPGTAVEIDIVGGSLKGASGVTRSFFPEETQKPGLQPQHTYLLQLVPCAAFYPCSASFFSVARKWDLTQGTVEPVDLREIRFKKDGHSPISGSDAATLPARFASLLDSLAGEK